MIKSNISEMNYLFTDKDIEKITEILGSKPEIDDRSYTWRLNDPQSEQPFYLTIYTEIAFSDSNKGSIAAVQTTHGYFELHNITAFIPFEPDEVIFIHQEEKFLSSLIAGRGATCSLFSNIDRDMLRRDFAELDPATLLAAMQLSIADSIS